MLHDQQTGPRTLKVKRQENLEDFFEKFCISNGFHMCIINFKTHSNQRGVRNTSKTHFYCDVIPEHSIQLHVK